MKFIHLSDLHIGIRLFERSMLEDQRYILEEIQKIVEEERPDAVLIAGDIYDKSVPPTSAVMLFDSFLTTLSEKGFPVIMIGGNHDSSERLSFGSSLMSKSEVTIAPAYRGETVRVEFSDAYGRCDVYLLPHIRPSDVRAVYPDESIESYTDAVRAAIAHMPIDKEVRNVLLTHQFILGAVPRDSEEVTVGGTDAVSAEVYQPFDYVAAGHIHSAQDLASGQIRYSGTPLPYSFSEAKDEKSVTVVELMEKGRMTITTRPLCPLRPIQEHRGSFASLCAPEYYKNTNTDAYVHITLTDEDDIPDGVLELRKIYPNLLRLDYDNTRTRESERMELTGTEEKRAPLDYFAELYEAQNNRPLTETERAYLEGLILKIFGEEL